ncbi:hypothetical protein Vretimale_11389 [Volvox reticuliferus]|uniref:ABC transporter domain-containing protein n=1 Tax=Volvox reticuliferus TaxID=1737510 RepID=A0A8J4GI46_9CHLO|nr:hypothetical protein Vretifemale_11905 [Volvox reticuliferus]GIM07305.1 hypothetical protein Vretimale_11389 [Volvox reticuliferus]
MQHLIKVMTPLLEVRNLRRDVADRNILANISFTLEPGEILFIRGPSGVGKSLLLRALACLDHPQGGTLLLHGCPPAHVGYPAWRTAVSYVPQSRASSLKGTPAELYFQSQRFSAQRARPRGDLPALVHALGLEQLVLNQQWNELSGGQSQRVALAISLALGPQVLLLDEPSSACDLISTLRVERVLSSCGAALVWVTHDPQQLSRVGGRLLELPLGTIVHLPPPPLASLPPVLQVFSETDTDGGSVSTTSVRHSSLPTVAAGGAVGNVAGAATSGGLIAAMRPSVSGPAELLDGDAAYGGYSDIPLPATALAVRRDGRSGGGA